MKNIYFIFSILLILLFYSCSNIQQKIKFSLSTSYEFIGTVSSNGETYIGFCKKNFNPTVKFFDIKGNLKDSLSLNKAQNILNEITNIWAYDKDSIAVYSNYNGILVIVDKSGNPISTHSYYDIKDSNGYNYDLLPHYPLYPYIQSERKDVFFSTWMWSGSMEKSPEQLLQDVQKGYLFCKIDPFSESKSIHFGFRYTDIIELKNRSDEKVFFVPFYKVLIVNNQPIMITNYSRYAYFLSNKLTVSKTIKILKDKDKVLLPIPMNKPGSIQDKANETVKNKDENNYIANVLWNDVNRKYLFIVKEGAILNNNPDRFKFNIITYDENLKKLKTIKIEDENLLPVKSFIYSGNLYVETYNKALDSKVFKKINL